MSQADVAELREKLAKSEEARQKLRHSLGLLKEHAVNAQVAVDALKKTKAQLKDAQQAAADEQRRRVMAEQAAAAAREAAATAERQAQRAATAATAAQADASDVRRQLREVQAQLARVQAACESGALAARQQAPAQQQQGVLSAAAAAALQEKVEGMAAELGRWRAALGPLAALAAGTGVSGPGLAPPPAPAPAPARPTSPQKQRRGRKPAAAAAGPAAAAVTGVGGAGPASPRGAQATAEAAATAPPQPPAEDARSRAVRQVAARQAEGAAAAARGPPAAAANVFVDALGSLEAGRPAKRAKRAAQQAGQQQAAAPQPVPAPPAPAEPSLAVSANDLPAGHPREHPAAADEAAQLLGGITAAAASGGPGISLEAVRRAAADLHFRLAEGRLPLLLLVRCFETAVLDAAASAPQGHLQLQGGGGVQQQSGAAEAVAEAAPDGWFGSGPLGASNGDGRGDEEARHGGGPPFAAVWCKREALAGRHLPWLLHCAAEVQRLHSARAAAAAALAAASEDSEQPACSGSSDGESFAAALRQHMHREVLSWCLAAGNKAGADVGSGGGCGAGSRVRHTETEACALAATTAALCRMAGDLEAFSALLLDLLTCPAVPTALMPPLAAAVDVWPAAVAALGAGAGASMEAAGAPAAECRRLRAGFHAALQRLCAQVEDLAASEAWQHAGTGPEQQLASAGSATAAGDGPPPLLLERQPAAAVVYLRRLGQRAWGWLDGAAGDAQAADGLKATAAAWRSGRGDLGDASHAAPPAGARAAQGRQPAAAAKAADAALPAAAKVTDRALGPGAGTAGDESMEDVEEEEI